MVGPGAGAGGIDPRAAETVLSGLAEVYFQNASQRRSSGSEPSPNLAARYRALVEQIPAVVFMAYLDQGIGEAYVSPQIERSLGFSQREWLQDPVRWYRHIHPDDKDRWSVEAAQMFLTGEPLRSAYRVLARDGRTIWFHCEAKMVRDHAGRPWFIHGVAFDITELKNTEEALAEERNVLSAILDTVGALVAVLDPEGRIVRFNRACEQATGYSSAEVAGKHLWDGLLAPDESARFRAILLRGAPVRDYESYLLTRDGRRRLISWSTTVLPGAQGQTRFVIATGIDIMERKRLEQAVLEISNSEQRRIGQDLHDGLGQHLTGIAFLSKALEQKIVQRSLPEPAEATRIVQLVNEGIHKTRELARGLLPVSSDPMGLVTALERWASEVEDLFHISCRFEYDDPAPVQNAAATNHLYRIAQEAVHNAIRHGRARNVRMYLRERNGRGFLSIEDDGSGIKDGDANNSGMGLSIMRYRAGMIGGTLEIGQPAGGGAVVTCAFPYRSEDV